MDLDVEMDKLAHRALAENKQVQWIYFFGGNRNISRIIRFGVL